MKVTGPSGPSSSSSSARPSHSGGGFALPASGGASPAGATPASGGVSSVAGVSALMALQGVEDVTERRRRAIRRGNGLLDRLEEVKLALLSGEVGEGALERLARSLREERTLDGDADLDRLLDQIDLRAAVELAKADLRRTAT